MDKENDKSINEIIGLTTGTVSRQPVIAPPARPAQQRSVAGVKIGFSAQLHGWQSQVVDTLARGKDVYVIATPSAGKTLPVVTYWAKRFLGINPELLVAPALNNPQQVYNGLMNLFLNPERIPKLLFLVPVRTLVSNTFEDFIGKFSELLWVAIQKSIPLQNVDILISKLIRYKGGDNLARIDRLRQDLTLAQANNTITPDEYAQRSQKIYNDFIKQLEITIPDFIKNTLVYAKTGVGSEGKANPRIAPVIITIYESVQSIFNSIKDQIGLAVIDEAHLTQQLPDVKDPRTEEIADKLYWFIERLPTRTRLAFLSGTINPNAAEELSNYLKYYFGRPLEQLNNAPVGNPATIKVIPADWVNDETALVREIVNPRMSNTLIVIFSKNKIDNLVDIALSKSGYATAQQVSGGIYQRSKLTTFGKETTRERPNFKITADAEKISDEKLSRAVSAGFGWIYRPSDELSNVDQRARQKDNGIVANLFKTGKIKTLLATDAVGIGINIDVQRMIIPSIRKFTGRQEQELPVSQLAQLLNRTGRQAFKIGVVYTSEENVGKVVHALSIGPEQFETRVTVPKKVRYTETLGRVLWRLAIGSRIMRR